MNDFNWRNKPRTTTSPRKTHVVTEPLPITFNGATRLSSKDGKSPLGRIYKLNELNDERLTQRRKRYEQL